MTDVGLILVRGGSADDRFVAALVHGLEETIVSAGLRLTTRVVADRRSELEAYRLWARTGAVDVVVLIDARAGDERLKLLRKLDLPFVEIVDSEGVDDASAVVTDTGAMAGVLLRFLGGAGFGRVIYLAGPAGIRAGVRGAALRSGAAAAGIRLDQAEGDTLEEALEEARRVADGGSAAVVTNDDVTAVAAVAAFLSAGLRVPEDVAVVSWTDSVVCQSSDPPITALNARANEVGALLGECVLKTLATGERVQLVAPRPFIVARASA